MPCGLPNYRGSHAGPYVRARACVCLRVQCVGSGTRKLVKKSPLSEFPPRPTPKLPSMDFPQTKTRANGRPSEIKTAGRGGGCPGAMRLRITGFALNVSGATLFRGSFGQHRGFTERSPGTGTGLRLALGWDGHSPFTPQSHAPSVNGQVAGRDALEGIGPQGRPQKWLAGRLQEGTKAVGGGYCRLQTPLKVALGVRGTVAGHRLGALEEARGPERSGCADEDSGRGGGGGIPMHLWWQVRMATSVTAPPPQPLPRPPGPLRPHTSSECRLSRATHSSFHRRTRAS